MDSFKQNVVTMVQETVKNLKHMVQTQSLDDTVKTGLEQAIARDESWIAEMTRN